MTDIVEMLLMTANKEFGTYDAADDSVRVGCQTLRDAADEIEQLRRRIEVAKERGFAELQEISNSFRDIKQGIKDGPSI